MSHWNLSIRTPRAQPSYTVIALTRLYFWYCLHLLVSSQLEYKPLRTASFLSPFHKFFFFVFIHGTQYSDNTEDTCNKCEWNKWLLVVPSQPPISSISLASSHTLTNIFTALFMISQIQTPHWLSLQYTPYPPLHLQVHYHHFLGSHHYLKLPNIYVFFLLFCLCSHQCHERPNVDLIMSLPKLSNSTLYIC